MVHLPVLSAQYGESPYKTSLYGDFLKLYDDGQANRFSPPGSLPLTHIKVLKDA
jgi:hypothetical protein